MPIYKIFLTHLLNIQNVQLKRIFFYYIHYSERQPYFFVHLPKHIQHFWIFQHFYSPPKKNLMDIVERVKNILLNPKKEWDVIDKETTDVPQLITGYLLLLALIPGIASLLGYWIFGYKVPFMENVPGTFGLGLRYGVLAFVTPVISVFITAFVINILADSFGSTKDFRRAMQLVVYSYTASLLAGVFNLIPSLGILAFLAGLYGLYILYVGLQPMMKTPSEKVTSYFIVSLLVMIVAGMVIGGLLSLIFIGRGMMV
jgi:hypothetical protein